MSHYWLPAIHRPIYVIYSNKFLSLLYSRPNYCAFQTVNCIGPTWHTDRMSRMAHYLRRSYVCGPTLASPAMWHWGTCPPPRDFHFSGHFRAPQTLTLDSMWLSAHKEYTGTQHCHCLLHESDNNLVWYPKIIQFKFRAPPHTNPGDANAARVKHLWHPCSNHTLWQSHYNLIIRDAGTGCQSTPLE